MTATLRPIGVLKALAWADDAPEHPAVTVPHGQSIESACREAGVQTELVALFLVNGHPQPGAYVLEAGDDIKLIALVGGG